MLTILLVGGPSVMASSSNPFNDVGDRYDEAIEMLYSSNAVKGISETEFGVYQNIKRGDAAVILARVLELDTVNAPKAGFKDVNSRISGHVNALVQAGIIKGFSETEFAPDHYLTRGQMASILVKAYGLQEYTRQTPFSDLSKSFKGEIEALYGAGITDGISAHKYGTNLNINRGDFAALLYKTMKFSKKNNPELKGQDISDITKLAVPDEIVYLHDGVKMVYTKEHPKFNKIIQLNNNRQTEPLGALKLFVDFNDVAVHGDYLIYQYKNTNFVPVYFKLAPSPDESFGNWIMNKYGTKIPADGERDPAKTMAHGHLAPADELLAYLNDNNTNFGLVVSEKTLPADFYEAAFERDTAPYFQYLIKKVVNQSEFEATWTMFGFESKTPNVDFNEKDVIFIGVQESGSCPNYL